MRGIVHSPILRLIDRVGPQTVSPRPGNARPGRALAAAKGARPLLTDRRRIRKQHRTGRPYRRRRGFLHRFGGQGFRESGDLLSRRQNGAELFAALIIFWDGFALAGGEGDEE